MLTKNSNPKNPDYQVITGLFDIRREELDGRDIQFYLIELEKLLSKFPNTIVFHNVISEEFQISFPNVNFVYLEISSLPLFKYYPEINLAIDAIRKNTNSKDLVHRSPEYGIIINSKLYFLEKASSLTQSEFLIWTDAGISRFFSDHEFDRLEIDLPESNSSVDGVFQIDIRNWLRQFSFTLPPSRWVKLNSSTRIISGGTFIVRKDSANLFAQEFQKILLDRFSRGVWDTEQMFFFYLLKKFKIRYSIQRINQPISVFNVIKRKKMRRFSLIDRTIKFFLPPAI